MAEKTKPTQPEQSTSQAKPMEEEEEEEKGRCASCRRRVTSRLCWDCGDAFICSEDCHEFKRAHLSDCRAKTSVMTTADELKLAIAADLIPSDNQTLLDYGFTKCKTSLDMSNLLGIYRTMISTFNLSPRQLNRWMQTDELGKNIRAAFEKSINRVPMEYYLWLMTHPEVFEKEKKTGLDGGVKEKGNGGQQV